jgi:hypothetical protein
MLRLKTTLKVDIFHKITKHRLKYPSLLNKKFYSGVDNTFNIGKEKMKFANNESSGLSDNEIIFEDNDVDSNSYTNLNKIKFIKLNDKTITEEIEDLDEGINTYNRANISELTVPSSLVYDEEEQLNENADPNQNILTERNFKSKHI